MAAHRQDWDLSTIPDTLLFSEYSRRRAKLREYKTKDAEVSPEQAEKNRKNREYVRKSRANSDFGYPRSQS
jgi:hypothetical protein